MPNTARGQICLRGENRNIDPTNRSVLRGTTNDKREWTPVDATLHKRQAPHGVIAFRGIWGTPLGWYLEIYDIHGELVSAQDDATFQIAMDAARACHAGAFGYICFRALGDAKAEQIEALMALGGRHAA